MGVDHLAPDTVSPVPPAAEWTVLRGLRWPGRWFPSVVRVLVGPAGVFVIAAHPTTAPVTLGEDRVWIGGRPDEQSLTDVTDAALVVAQHVGPYAAHVEPVLCFTSTAVSHRHAGDVLCTSVSDLVGWLSGRPAVLGARQADDVVTRLRMLMRAEVDREPAATGSRIGLEPPVPPSIGVAAPTAAPSSRFPSGLRAVPVAVSSMVRWVFRGGLAARFAVLTVLTLVMLAYGPGALSPLGNALGRAFSDATTPSACSAAGAAAGTASGLPDASASGDLAAQEQSTESDGSPQVQAAQVRAQWTPSGLTAASVAHPLCRAR